MPSEHRVDPTLLDHLARSLTRSNAAALDASDELLAHYGDTGDAPTQAAVDTLIDQAADALRGLAVALADSSRELTAASLHPTTAHHGDTGEAPVPSERGLDH